MREFAVYTAARLLVFLAAYALVIGVYVMVSGGEEIPLIWPFLLAVVISAIASVFLLRRQRDAFALAVQRRAQRASERLEQARSKEDEEDEARRGQQPPGRTTQAGPEGSPTDDPGDRSGHRPQH